jgi:OOP family OmpA-OmpF porin
MSWAEFAVGIVAALATLAAAYFAYVPIRGQLRRRRNGHVTEYSEDTRQAGTAQKHESEVQDSSAVIDSRGSHDAVLVGYLTGFLALAAVIGLIVLILYSSRSPANGTSAQNCAGGGPIVFAVSGRQNSPAPGLTGVMLAAVTGAINDGSSIAIVNVDGNPKLIFAMTFDDHQSRIVGQGLAIRFAAIVSDVRAKSPGADVLDALNVAGEWVRATCNHGGTIYLEDSGLQDVAPLNFTTPGLLEENPAQIAKSLLLEQELPELNGMSVVLAGIGDTAPPQRPLTIKQQKSLRKIWSAVVTAAGARQPVQVDLTPRSEPPPSHVPPVQLIPIPQESQLTSIGLLFVPLLCPGDNARRSLPDP